MIFRIHCELASALVMLALTAVFLNQKHLRTYQSRVFKLLLISAALLNLVDSAKLVAVEYGDPSSMLGMSLYILYTLIFFISCMLFPAYAMTVFGRWDIIQKFRPFWNFIYLVVMVMVATTPWTKLMFYQDAEGKIVNAPAYYGIYIIAFVYLLIPFILRIMGKYHANRREQWMIFSTPFILVGAMFIQRMIWRPAVVFYVIYCMIIFSYSLFLQNSDYYLDEVTGFFKMHGFEAVLREKLAYKEDCSILLIRIMNYNAMTEMYEDAKLSQIQGAMAKLMSKQCGNKDFYHISASTFAVISKDRDESEQLHQILLEHLPKVWTLENDREEIVHEYCYYNVVLPEGCDSLNELIQRIQYARSDHKGHHEPGELITLTSNAVKHVRDKQMVADLVEQAVMDNSIEIYFQPIYSLEKGRVTSLEVLSRLKDRDKNFINPEFFIQVAEENGDILALGEQIYRKACIFATQNHIFEMGIEDININLSPVQCCYEELASDLIRIAGEYDIPMSRMHLEITESGIMDKEEIWETLETLRSSGAKIALDDFGTGYSNITSIVTLPVDFVKIDKSLVWSYGRGENKYLDQLVPMIHAEGKRIISEGIETQEHIDIFKRLHGDFLQGYFYSRPLPEQDFIRYLREANEIV